MDCAGGQCPFYMSCRGLFCRQSRFVHLAIGILGTSCGLLWAFTERQALSKLLKREKDLKAERNEASQRLLEQHQDRALALAVSGLEEATERAIKDAMDLGASEEWEQMLRGVLLTYAGKFGAAVKVLKTGRDSEAHEGQYTLAIRSALATAYIAVGDTDEAVAELAAIMEMQPQSPEDRLLKAQALVYGPNSGECLLLIDEYFRQRHDSAVGRIARATATLATVSRDSKPDPQKIEEAATDAMVASELMPESAFAVLTQLLVHSGAFDIYTAAGDSANADRHRRQAIAAANELKSERLQSSAAAHGNAAIFHERIGDEVGAREHWELAKKAGMSGYQLARYALFELRYSDRNHALQLLDDAQELCSWSRLVRAVLELDMPARRRHALSELLSLRDAPATSLLVLGVLHAADELPKQADSTDSSRHEMWSKDDGLMNAAAEFFGEGTPPEVLLDPAPNQQGLAHICIALRFLGEADGDAALESLRRAIMCNELRWSFFQGFCKTVIQLVEANPHWPRPADPWSA